MFGDEIPNSEWLEMLASVQHASRDYRRVAPIRHLRREPVETPWQKRSRLAKEEAARKARIAKLKPERAKNRARRKARRNSN